MTDKEQLDAITALAKFLLKRHHEMWAKHESMRLLLEAKGVFLEAEFDAYFARVQSDLSSDLQAQAQQGLKKAEDAELARLLRDIEGTKH
jgi:hypothetical protein